MNYAHARGSIRSGDLLAWSAPRGLGRMVRILTGGSWSHVGIAWWSGPPDAPGSRLFVLEMREFRGVTMRPASAAVPFDWVRLGATWTPEATTAVFDEFGSPYGWGALIPLWLGRWRRRHGRVCSTWAADRLRAAGITIRSDRHGHTPSSLVESLIRNGLELRGVVR